MAITDKFHRFIECSLTPRGLETIVEVMTVEGQIVRRVLGPYPMQGSDPGTPGSPVAPPAPIPALSKDEIQSLVKEGEECSREARRRIAPMLNITHEDLHRKMK